MLKGNILTTDGWIHGTIRFENGRVTAIEGERVDPSTNGAPYILPGFIDLHVHGGGGADIMEGGDAAQTVARLHAQHGTTSLLATTMTAPRDELMRVVAGLGDQAKYRARRRSARARRASRRSVYQSRQARRAAGRRGRRRARRSAEVSCRSRRSASSRSRRKSPATWTSSPSWRRAACACKWAIRSAPTTTPSPRSSTARAASRICSTRCRRCITAIPAWSARRSRTPNTRS